MDLSIDSMALYHRQLLAAQNYLRAECEKIATDQLGADGAWAFWRAVHLLEDGRADEAYDEAVTELVYQLADLVVRFGHLVTAQYDVASAVIALDGHDLHEASAIFADAVHGRA